MTAADQEMVAAQAAMLTSNEKVRRFSDRILELAAIETENPQIAMASIIEVMCRLSVAITAENQGSFNRNLDNLRDLLFMQIDGLLEIYRGKSFEGDVHNERQD